MRSRPITFR